MGVPMKEANGQAVATTVTDQIVGFNRQLAFALNFVESVVRQGNRRAAIEVLDEQRSAIARTSEAVCRTLIAPHHRRRRARIVGAVALAVFLLGSSAFAAIAVVRQTHVPVQRSSVTADPDAAIAGLFAGSPTGESNTRAKRGTSAATNSPQDAAALARGTNDLIGETLKMAVELSGLSSALDLTKSVIEAAKEAQAPSPPSPNVPEF